MLLDEDLGARGSSLARIYDDLGFQRLALVEGARSLGVDPANHSAHRFLSDSYALLPRHEIARASELLQAQLLQPVNISAVQPQLTQTDLNILGGAGPANVAFNEYTPLFERDRVQLIASGVGGNNATGAGEAVLTGVAGRLSYSAGLFYYQSDGYRENNDLRHNIYNLFAQAALTRRLSVQAEYRHRSSEEGDLRLNFDPEDFSTSDRREIEEDMARLGFHFAPSPQSDLVGSLIFSRGDEDLNLLRSGVGVESQSQDDGLDVQFQYQFRTDLVNITTGFGTYDIDVEGLTVLDFTGLFGTSCPFFVEPCDFTSESPIRQHNAYLYTNVTWPTEVTWTLGLGYDSFEQNPLDRNQFNPKADLQWELSDNVHLRLAYMKTVKRALVVDQTVEPTQVAGFNQFFDDVNGSEAERYGIGLDAVLPKNLYGGFELSRRDLQVPTDEIDTSRLILEEQQEDLYRAYLYLTPPTQWAVSAEYQFEQFKRVDTQGFDLPTQVKTTTVPLTTRYFSPTGIFAEVAATYVRQTIDLPLTSTFDQERENFVTVDAAFGFRMPQRRGLLTVEARNLFDEEFLFQDQNIQRQLPSNPQWLPDRTILVRLTLNF